MVESKRKDWNVLWKERPV